MTRALALCAATLALVWTVQAWHAAKALRGCAEACIIALSED